MAGIEGDTFEGQVGKPQNGLDELKQLGAGRDSFASTMCHA
jgi:hypothetical protein